MLSDHVNANKWVLGRWVDYKKEGAQLTALPEFDMDDEDAAKIAGKVERGFINGASVGLLFNYDDLAMVGGKVWLLKSTLIEATICPIPSNPNALQLYLQGKEDTPLTEAELKKLCLSLQPTEPENFNVNTMSTKISLAMRCLIALGLKDVPDGGMEKADIENHIMGLSAKLEAAELKATTFETENQQLKEAAKTAATSEGTAFLNAAVTDGKIKADEVAAYLSLYESNPALVKKSIEAIPGKTMLSAGNIKLPTGAPTEVNSDEDFMKLDDAAKLAFKAEYPDQYKKIFNLK